MPPIPIDVPLEPPLICLVTDRRRIAGPVDDLQPVLGLIGRAASAGVDLVQIREPDLADRRLFDLVQGAVRASAATRTRIIVNDRIDVALAAGAAGVHLKSSSPPSDRVKALRSSDWIVGRSVHSAEEAECVGVATGADYLVAGAIFETASKPGSVGIGISGLQEIAQAVDVPLLAIGGVTVEQAEQVARAGASGIAAIGAFVDAGDDIDRLVKCLRDEFDKGRSSLL